MSPNQDTNHSESADVRRSAGPAWLLPACAGVLLLAVYALYRQTLGADFVWDDEFLILDNPAIQSLRKIPDFFSYHLAFASQNRNIYYRPLQETSYALDYFFWKLDPKGFHLTNLVLHALNAVWLLAVVRRLTGKTVVAFAAAAFFAAQPMHTQAVAYVAGRADLLAAFFLLGALWAYLRAEGPRSAWLWGGAFLYLMALFSREVALALPFALAAYDLAFERRIRWDKLAVYFLPLAAFLGLRHWALAKTLPITNTSFYAPPFEIRFPLSFKLLFHYVSNLIWPRQLHMEQQIRAAGGWFDPWVLGGFGCYALAAWLWLRRRIDPASAFTAGWFLVFWFPVANLVPLHKALADHWMYLPSMGFYTALALAADRVLPGTSQVRAALAALAAVPLWIFFASYTFERNTAWKDSLTLYTDILEYDRDNSRVRLNLGNAYLRRGDLDMAEAAYQALIRKRPGASPEAHSNLGYIHYLRGRLEQAESHLKQAVAQDPRAAIARTNLALVYQKMNRFEDSRACLNEALALSPGYYQASLAMGMLLLRMDKPEEAVPYLERAAQLAPDDPRPANLLDILRRGDKPPAPALSPDVPADAATTGAADEPATGQATYVIVKKFDEWGEVVSVEEK